MSALKVLIVGDPKAGKTGSCASLANAGFKLRVVNFDGNVDTLRWYLTPEGASRTDIRVFLDDYDVKVGQVRPKTAPQAYTKALQALSSWDGPPAHTWGEDTVLVVDPLSHMSDRLLAESAGLNERDVGPQDYGDMAERIGALLLYLKALKCHVVAITHLRVLGEKMDLRPQAERQRDPKVVAPVGSHASTLSWKRYPSVRGRALPTELASYFPVVLHAKVEGSGSAVRRVLSLVPDVDVDVAAPVHLFGGRTKLEIATGGLAEVFKTLGHGAPALAVEEKKA